MNCEGFYWADDLRVEGKEALNLLLITKDAAKISCLMLNYGYGIR